MPRRAFGRLGKTKCNVTRWNMFEAGDIIILYIMLYDCDSFFDDISWHCMIMVSGDIAILLMMLEVGNIVKVWITSQLVHSRSRVELDSNKRCE